MSNSLLVPIHLDALSLLQTTAVAEEMTDYTLLPYYYNFNNWWERNANEPFLSSTVLSPPFEHLNLNLEAGIHLHWSLPDALTKGLNTATGLVFPAVPNRWLIMRSGGDMSSATWVVESDYLHPCDIRSSNPPENVWGSINILYPPEEEYYQPFRFMGRTLTLSEWRNREDGGEYVDRLTAIGGLAPEQQVKTLDNEKAAFAAFYPNCRSVFGFHDADLAGQNPPQNLQYNVIGWYSDSQQDYLSVLLQEHPNSTPEELLEALLEKSGWTVNLENKSFPRQTICYSKLKFTQSGSPSDPTTTIPNPVIAVGNTATEALAAYLSHDFAPGSDSNSQQIRQIIEDQLEALQLTERLEQQKLDVGPKFRDARHEREFSATDGGMLWRVLPESNSSVPANAAEKQAQAQVTLPPIIAEKLNTLNLQQQSYDKALNKIGSMREQVYADWCKYLMLSYGGIGGDDMPSDEAIRDFIYDEVIPPLNQEIAKTGVLNLGKDDQEEVVSASAPNSAAESTASQLAQNINQTISTLNDFNKISRFQVDTGTRDFTPSELTLNGSCTLVEDAQAGYCLSLDGAMDYLRLSGFGNNIKAISLWVKIPNISSGSVYLLDAGNTSADQRWISAQRGNSVGSDWEKMYVNGMQMSSISWQNIPKEAWAHIYLESRQNFSSTINLLSRFTGDGRLSGRLASIRLHQQPVAAEVIAHNYNNQTFLLRPAYGLKSTRAPRYWQPNEPVILMTGDAVTPTHRHGQDGRLRQDGLLECQLLDKSLNLETVNTTTVDDLKTFLGNVNQGIGVHNWTKQPWNPFLLEWGAKLFPVRRQTTTDSNNYDPEFVDDNYDLAVDQVDLTLKPNKEDFSRSTSDYTGASILTPAASKLLKDKLTVYLTKQLLPSYYEANNIPEAQQTDSYLSEHLATVKTWYEGRQQLSTKSASAQAQDPFYTALRAYEKLQNVNCLAQTLSGFNDALMTYDRVMQLHIEDTMASSDFDLQFETDIKKLMTDTDWVNSLLRMPTVRKDFNPIRSGAMNVVGLRIIDTFGRFKVVQELGGSDTTAANLTEVTTTELMATSQGSDYQVLLPPRLTQPARFNFRWLSARQGQQETNDHPATTPICGWVLPNNLDNSLMVYDHQGSPVGFFDRNAVWKAIPGSPKEIPIRQIGNFYLRQLVQFLKDQGAGFLAQFLTTINSSLETIDPEGFAEHQSMALLMGRPIALVRASVNLELKDLPAVNQSRDALKIDADDAHNERVNDGFTKVKFPIRIGEYQQYNDGLIGYWIENEDRTYQGSNFYAPQSCYINHNQIKTLFDNATDTTPNTPVNLEQTLEPSSAQTLAMLVDPRGKINATCGILPNKQIQIPPEQYAEALRTIEVTFLTAPILSDQTKLNVSLPEVDGYTWTWLSKEGDTWSETSEIGTFNPKAAFTTKQKINEGWLNLNPVVKTDNNGNS